MALRAYWTCYLKYSSVSCAVASVPAVSTLQRIRFNSVSRTTGDRVRTDLVDAETGGPVPEEDRVKGYRRGDGTYVGLDDHDGGPVVLGSTDTLAIERVVPTSTETWAGAATPRNRMKTVG